uniref:Uncharacterized protein n=1 Tax=Macrostomum lignano TaxID=282301 RepID=A0A1I8FMN8_9PLAT
MRVSRVSSATTLRPATTGRLSEAYHCAPSSCGRWPPTESLNEEGGGGAILADSGATTPASGAFPPAASGFQMRETAGPTCEMFAKSTDCIRQSTATPTARATLQAAALSRRCSTDMTYESIDEPLLPPPPPPPPPAPAVSVALAASHHPAAANHSNRRLPPAPPTESGYSYGTTGLPPTPWPRPLPTATAALGGRTSGPADYNRKRSAENEDRQLKPAATHRWQVTSSSEWKLGVAKLSAATPLLAIVTGARAAAVRSSNPPVRSGPRSSLSREEQSAEQASLHPDSAAYISPW